MTPVSPISMPSSGITEGEDVSDDDDLDVLLDSNHETLSPLTRCGEKVLCDESDDIGRIP